MRSTVAPLYIDDRPDRAWGHDDLLLNVADGPPEEFSLSAGAEDRHFVTHSVACAVPRESPARQ